MGFLRIERMKTIIGYKFVTSNIKSKEGNITWKLGEWQKHKGKIELCESGFHACKEPRDAFRSYIYGDRFFIVEARGEIVKADDKFVASEMRLVKEINLKMVSVEWAVYCARSVLNIYEKKYPNDNRPRKAIESAEEWFKNSTEENRVAAKATVKHAKSEASWAARAAEAVVVVAVAVVAVGAAVVVWAAAAAALWAAGDAEAAAAAAARADWAAEAAAKAAGAAAAAEAAAAAAEAAGDAEAAAGAAKAAGVALKKQNTYLKKIIKKWMIE